jgi:hypothetical protein
MREREREVVVSFRGARPLAAAFHEANASLRDGHVDPHKMLALAQEVREGARQQGFPLTRLVPHTASLGCNRKRGPSPSRTCRH